MSGPPGGAPAPSPTPQEVAADAMASARWTTVSAAATGAAGLLQLAILARLLRPEDFGLLAMAMLVVGLAAVYTDFGMSAAIVFRRDVTREQLSSLHWLNVAGGAAVYAAVWLAAPGVAALFGRPEVASILRAAGAVLVVVPAARAFEQLLQRELAFRALALAEIAGTAAGAVLAIAGAAAGWGVWALVAGTVAAPAVRAALVAAAGARRFRPMLRLRRADLRALAGFGLFRMGEQSVNYAGQRLDQLVVGGLLGAPALGLYNLAVGITAQPASRLNPVVTRVAFPVLARIVDDRDLLRRGYLRVVALLTAVNAPLLLGLAATAPTLVPLVFGAQWTESVPLVQVMALVALSRAIGNPVGTLQLARGRADLGFKWNAALLAVSIPVTAAGAAAGGVLGIAVSLLLLQLALQVASYRWLVRELVGPCAGAYARAVVPPVALAAAMALAVAPIGRLGGAAPVATLAAQVATGAAIYGAGLFLFQRQTFAELRQFAGARA